MKKFFFLLMFVGAIGLLFIAGCDDDDNGGPTNGVPQLSYVGSSTCATCHSDIAADFANNGHGYKLNKVENGQAPTYPYSTVPNTPAGYTWNDVSYVIGGFGWKARFVDNDGYIITGDAVQYNLETQAWSGYHSDEAPGTKSYDCGRCHTTGWVSVDDGGDHQDGMPGMAGSFSEPGVKCEACHGMGSKHADSRDAADITIDRTSLMCGGCHYRDSEHRVEAKGGFIRHHEQYDELISAGHVNLSCIECHDPHVGQQSPAYLRSAMLDKCSACHTDETNVAHPMADCIECHLSEATKSAVKSSIYDGDVKTHIFKINTAAVGKDSMWYDAGGLTYANGAVTLDFACYQCHNDPDGVGGGGSGKTLQELSAKATGFHD